MNQLESITFINSQRFPYAHIDLRGNTILAGTNGGGKTSSLRAALFYYGISDKAQLGIRSDSKLPFGPYFLQDENSYIFYTYTNSHGKVLLMVWRPADKIRFRFAFIEEEVDLKALVLDENGVALTHDELAPRMENAGIWFSEPVMISEYREIIYGQGKRELKKYALFEATTDYAQIPITLSSIFVSSTVKSSSIQNALAGCIEGASTLDLAQIRRKVRDESDRYERIRGFESKHNETKRIIESYRDYNGTHRRVVALLRQLAANAAALRIREQELSIEAERLAEKIREKDAEYIDRFAKSDKEIEELIKKQGIIENWLQDARRKIDEYKRDGIDQKLREWAMLDQLKIQLKRISDRYEQLLGDNKDRAEAFDRQIEAEQTALREIKVGLDERRGKIERELNAVLTANASAEKREREELYAKRDAGKKEMVLAVENAQLELSMAQEAFAEAKHAAPGKEDCTVLQETIAHHERESRAASIGLKAEEKRCGDLQTAIGELDVSLQSLYKDHEKLLASKLIPIDAEIEKQQALLDIADNSLLGFLRNERHPHEQQIAALLKDDILLNTELSPRIHNDNNTLYGVDIDTSALNLSRYDLVAIEGEIEKLQAIKQQITEEVETATQLRSAEILTRKMQREKELRGCQETMVVLKEQARDHEMRMLEAKTLLNELQERLATEKKARIATAETKAAKARVAHSEAKEALRLYDNETNKAMGEIAARYESDRSMMEAKAATSLSEIDAEHIRVEKVIADNIEKIAHQKQKALLEGGVSEQDLREAEEERKTAAEAVSRISNYQFSVEKYSEDKRNCFDRMEEQEKEEILIGEKLVQAKAGRDHLQRERDEAIKLLNMAKTSAESEIRICAGECERYDKFVAEGRIALYVDLSAGELPLPTDETPTDLIEAIRKLHETLIECQHNMRTGLNEILSIVGDDNHFGLERPESSLSSLLSASATFVRFIEEGRLTEVKKQVAQHFRMAHNMIREAVRRYKTSSDEVDRMIKKMNAYLRDLSGIRVIEAVEVKYQHSEIPALEMLSKVADADVGLGFEATLFNPNPDHAAVAAKILRSLKDLTTEIEKERRDTLTLADSFSLQFRVIENGNDSGWKPSLDDIGSNGTDVLVKTMIYVVMLDMVISQAQRSGTRAKIHVVLDEVGVLHQQYLSELIDFANSRGIYFFNGAPDPKIPSKYTATYTIRQESSRISSMLPTARRL